MASILQSIAKTIINEGGYEANPLDSGGRTKYGITQRDLDATLPGYDIEFITVSFATNWYLTTTKPERYNNPLYSQLNSQELCDKIFDLGVLFGVGEIVEQLQTELGIAVDGNFGPETLATANNCGDSLLGDPSPYPSGLRARLHEYAASVALKHPNDAGFVNGWDARIDKL